MLSHDVNPVEVAVVLLLGADNRRGRDGWLRNQMVRYLPLEVGGLEVADTLLRGAVGDADVDTVGGEHAVNLSQHLSGVGARAVTAQD